MVAMRETGALMAEIGEAFGCTAQYADLLIRRVRPDLVGKHIGLSRVSERTAAKRARKAAERASRRKAKADAWGLAVSLYRQGFTQVEISQRIGVSQAAVSAHLKRNGIPTRPNWWPAMPLPSEPDTSRRPS